MSFELNKIFGALLGVMIFVMGFGFLAKGLYASRLEGPGYVIKIPEKPRRSGSGCGGADCHPPRQGECREGQ